MSVSDPVCLSVSDPVCLSVSDPGSLSWSRFVVVPGGVADLGSPFDNGCSLSLYFISAVVLLLVHIFLPSPKHYTHKELHTHTFQFYILNGNNNKKFF